LIAVFIALGGSSYAAVKLNGKNVRDRTVAAAKLKRDTVTGRELREASLGPVPAAAVATTAGSAGSADNADRLDGQDSSQRLGRHGLHRHFGLQQFQDQRAAELPLRPAAHELSAA
jgi:hypothetical protein